ncbi:hypothetical protein BGM09_01290 [Streptomyces sp. CBMA29]|nr:hypothetical protein [Streptomyces sp. CBMA29]
MKRTPGLAAYLDSVKESNALFGDISRHVLSKAARPNSHRSDVIYPSEVVKAQWCQRATYLRIVNGRVPERTSFRMQNIFEEGNRTHEKWQDWLAEMRRLEGDWGCQGCGNQFYARGPEKCPRCHGSRFKYRELRLIASDLMLSGRCDGYLPADGCLIEIKTLGLGSLRYESPGFVARYEVETPRGTVIDLERMWKDLRRPLGSAVKQGILYLHLAREYVGLDVDRCEFLYDFKATQETKAFTVMYDEAKADALIGSIRQMANCVIAREIPDCPVSSDGCRDCKPYQAAS